MNRVRTFKPELFTMLEIPEREISKAQLSGILNQYIKQNNLDQRDGELRYIQINRVIAKLLETQGTKIYLFKGTKKITDWWDFVTMVYTKWKL